MRRFKYTFLFFLLAVGLYLSLTWFFFGSPHPCGILEARQKSYVLERVREGEAKQRELQFALAKLLTQKLTQEERAETRKTFEESLAASEKAPKRALDGLHEHIWRLTPAQCTWRAIVWNPDPYKRN